MDHTLFSEEHQLMLKTAAKYGGPNPEILNSTIQNLKILAPEKFLTEADLEKRVFIHQPRGMWWSGKAIFTKSAYYIK